MNNQIPKNWQKVKLGEYINVQAGFAFKSAFFNERTGVPLIRIRDLSTGKPSIKYNGPYSKQYLIKDGDVLIGMDGEFKSYIWKGGEAILNQRVCRLVNPKGIDYLFAFYALNRKLYEIEKGTVGTTVIHLSTSDVENIELNAPTLLSEQKKIGSILSAFDDKIEVNNKIAKTLEEMAQALFKEWFVNFRFPEYEKAEFVVSELGKVPKGWKIGKLKELVTIRNGFAFKSSDYGSKGIPIVRTMNFTDKGSVQLDDIVYLSIEKAKKYKSFYLEEFDFLLVMVGASVGKWSIVPSNILPALQNQNMWDFMPKKEEYRFFNIYLFKKMIKEQKGSTTGSARDFFRKDYFYSLNVFIPNSEILREFNLLVEPIYRRLDTILNENQKLAALRDLLLPKLMKGEIRT